MVPVFYHVFSALPLQKVYDSRPFSTVIKYRFKDGQVLLQQPLSPFYADVHMVEPVLSALFRSLEEVAS